MELIQAKKTETLRDASSLLYQVGRVQFIKT